MAKTGKSGKSGGDDKKKGKRIINGELVLVGHKFSSTNQPNPIPYDQRMIRDELKTNFYKAANFLNMTETEAQNFVAEIKAAQESGIVTKITVFEALIVDGIMQRRWDLIDRILDRIFGKYEPMLPNDGKGSTMMDEITEEQKKRAIEVASKVMANG